MKRLQHFAPGAALGLSLLISGAAQADPIVKNGGFEPTANGLITGWAAQNSASLVVSHAHAHSGSGFGAFRGGYIAQRLTGLKVGQEYMLSGYLSPGVKGSNFEAYVQSASPQTFVDSLGSRASAYHLFQEPFIAQLASPTLGFAGGVPESATRPIRLDDVSVTAVPEVDLCCGASAVALTLGGLALMLERKRAKAG